MSDAPPPPAPAGMNAKDAKANAKAAAAYAKAQRPFWKKKRFILSGAHLAIIIIAVASGGGSSDKDKSPADKSPTDKTGVQSISGNKSNPPEADVVIDSCDYEDVIGTVTAKLTITNNSSKRSNYLITINIEDGSGIKIGEALASSNNVEGGQVAKEDALGTISGEKPADMKCIIKEVNRFAS